jgi:hypothetical protein
LGLRAGAVNKPPKQVCGCPHGNPLACVSPHPASGASGAAVAPADNLGGQDSAVPEIFGGEASPNISHPSPSRTARTARGTASAVLQRLFSSSFPLQFRLYFAFIRYRPGDSSVQPCSARSPPAAPSVKSGRYFRDRHGSSVACTRRPSGSAGLRRPLPPNFAAEAGTDVRLEWYSPIQSHALPLDHLRTVSQQGNRANLSRISIGREPRQAYCRRKRDESSGRDRRLEILEQEDRTLGRQKEKKGDFMR